MKGYHKAVLLVLFAAVVIYALKFSPLSNYLFTQEGREASNAEFKVFIEGLGFWGPFIFVGCYALSLMFFIPASIFTTLGGLIFGSWFGLLLNVIGALLGGTAAFLMSRYLMRGFAAKLLEKGHFKKIDDKAEEHGFSIIVYLRLMFVPYTYLSFAAGLSKIKFADFFWGTLAGVIPGLAVVTFLAVAVKQLFLTYKGLGDLLRPDIIGPLLLFGVSFTIPSIVKHFKKKFYVKE